METAPLSTAALPAQEVTFIRYLYASPEQVFDEWTLPERLREWWGPEGADVVGCELDVRPGGVFQLAVRGPDGVVRSAGGTYLEVETPGRLRYSEVLGDAPGQPFVTTVTFEPMGAMTRMTVVQTAATAEPLATLQLTGWLEALTKLSERLLPH
ncbi:MAG TPA: SRPBCC domain-containing protein [Anaeromyxobacteraceae bacterium]|nr:SRPBCC domain-containing protein [Anaeromyxobacteraceae bacterium]